MKFASNARRFGSAAPAPVATVVASSDPVERALAAAAELTEGPSHEKATDRAERQRELDATDSEHWFAVNFETREQKEAFLRALGLFDEADKYLDGLAAAKILEGLLTKPRALQSAVEGLRAVAALRRPKLKGAKLNRRLAGLV